MESQADLFFGRIAVGHGMMTEQAVSQCITEQEARRTAGTEALLGAIAVEKGFLTPQQVQEVLRMQRFVALRTVDARFGKIAVRNGLSSPERLEEVLELQRHEFIANKRSVPIGEIMLEKGYLTLQQANAILAAQGRLAASTAAPPPAPGEAGIAEVYSGERCSIEVHRRTQRSEFGIEEQAVSTIVVSGDLDGHTFPHLEKALTGEVDRGTTRLVLDFKDLTYIASSGIGVILHLDRRLRDQGEGLYLVRVGPAVKSVFDLLGFGEIVWTFPSEEIALDEMRRRMTISDGLRAMLAPRSAAGGPLQIRLSGALDAHTFPGLEALLDKAMAAGERRIAVDFEGLVYVGSAGIGVLVNCMARLEKGGGKLCLAGMSREVRQVFNTLGISRIVTICDTVEEALAFLK